MHATPLLALALLCLCSSASAARVRRHVPLLQLHQNAEEGLMKHLPRAASEAAGDFAEKELQAALDFLYLHMPKQDRNTLSAAFVQSHAALALKARRANKWASSVPWELFLNYVLPYASLDEPREDWRTLFHGALGDVVKEAKSTSEVALLLNRDAFALWGIHFKPDQTPEIMSPSQVIKAGYASCTGLSIFLVNACRAVGIPARVAGTPSWVNMTLVQGRASEKPERFNNHNWVEVWDNGIWSWTGADEWTPAGWNRTWFWPQPAKGQVPGSYMHAIYAASYAPTPGRVHFPLAWHPSYEGVHAFDVTQAYLDLRR